MATRYELAEKVIDDLEGFQSYHAKDKGKRTLYGVAERSHPDYIERWWNNPYDPQAKVEAVEIMAAYADETHNFDQIATECPRLAYALIAGAIHGSGNEHYTAIIQAEVGFKGKAIDGIFGPKTFAKARKHGFYNCLDALRDALAYLIERRTKSVGEWARKGMRRRLEMVLINPDPFFDTGKPELGKTELLALHEESYRNGRFLEQRRPAVHSALSQLTASSKNDAVLNDLSNLAENIIKDDEILKDTKDALETVAEVKNLVGLLRTLGAFL